VTSKDKPILVRWLFVSLAASPAAKPYVSIKPDDAVVFEEGARIIDRLVTVDCRKEALAATKIDHLAMADAVQTLLIGVFDELIVEKPVFAAMMRPGERMPGVRKIKDEVGQQAPRANAAPLSG
jgi:hypothetical protein